MADIGTSVFFKPGLSFTFIKVNDKVRLNTRGICVFLSGSTLHLITLTPKEVGVDFPL